MKNERNYQKRYKTLVNQSHLVVLPKWPFLSSHSRKQSLTAWKRYNEIPRWGQKIQQAGELGKSYKLYRNINCLVKPYHMTFRYLSDAIQVDLTLILNEQILLSGSHLLTMVTWVTRDKSQSVVILTTLWCKLTTFRCKIYIITTKGQVQNNQVFFNAHLWQTFIVTL